MKKSWKNIGKRRMIITQGKTIPNATGAMQEGREVSLTKLWVAKNTTLCIKAATHTTAIKEGKAFKSIPICNNER